MGLADKLKQGFNEVDKEAEQLKIDGRFDFGYKEILEYLPEIYNKIGNIEKELEELKKKKDKTEDDVKKLESIADIVDKIISIGAEEIKKPEEKELTYDIYSSLREQGKTHKDVVEIAKEKYGIKEAHHKLIPFAANYKRWGKGIKDETKLEPVEEKKEYDLKEQFYTINPKIEEFYKQKGVNILNNDQFIINIILNQTYNNKSTKLKDLAYIANKIDSKKNRNNISVHLNKKNGMIKKGIICKDNGNYKIKNYDEISNLVEGSLKEIKFRKRIVKRGEKIKKEFDMKEFYKQMDVKIGKERGLLINVLYNRMVKNEPTTLSNIADAFNKIDPVKYEKRIARADKYHHTEPNSKIYSYLNSLIKKGIVYKNGKNYELKCIKKIKNNEFDEGDFIRVIHYDIDKKILKKIFKDFNKPLKGLRKAENKYRVLLIEAEEGKKSIDEIIKERYIDIRNNVHHTPDELINANIEYARNK